MSLPHLVAHLAEEFTAAGGLLRTGTGDGSVVVEDGRARGVRTADGQTVRADAVVVACGPQTPPCCASSGSTSRRVAAQRPGGDRARGLPRPRRAQHPARGVAPHTVGGFAVDHDWYLDDVVEHPDGSGDLPEAVVAELLGEAAAVLDGTPLRARTVRAGRKPVPADGEPVLGGLSAVPAASWRSPTPEPRWACSSGNC